MKHLPLLLTLALLSTTARGADPADFLTPRFAGVSTNSAIKFASTNDYKGRPTDLLLDVYQPGGDTATNRPVVMLVHGGGFRTSGVRDQKYIVAFANEFARRGFVAISIDYRQRAAQDMPESSDELPAMKDAAADALVALNWIRVHGAEYGYDPAAIFLAGGSAGGRITTALACRENGDTGGLPVTDAFSLTKPPSSVTSEAAADYDRTGCIAAAILWGGPEPEYRCFTVDANDLACVFIHGSYDATVPAEGSATLHDKLARAGVASELHFLNGYGHSLEKSDAASSDAKPQAAQWMADFFVQQWQRRLAGDRAPVVTPEIKLTTGQPLSLHSPVACSGFAPAYQWMRAGRDLAGATNAVLSVPQVGVGDAGLYEVRVSNPSGAWSSSVVSSLSVTNAPIASIDFERGADKRTHASGVLVPVARVEIAGQQP